MYMATLTNKHADKQLSSNPADFRADLLARRCYTPDVCVL